MVSSLLKQLFAIALLWFATGPAVRAQISLTGHVGLGVNSVRQSHFLGDVDPFLSPMVGGGVLGAFGKYFGCHLSGGATMGGYYHQVGDLQTTLHLYQFSAVGRLYVRPLRRLRLTLGPSATWLLRARHRQRGRWHPVGESYREITFGGEVGAWWELLPELSAFVKYRQDLQPAIAIRRVNADGSLTSVTDGYLYAVQVGVLVKLALN
ncbi:MAG: hypothetical protein WBA12_02795 [Catalinimonas sp.]